MQNDFDTNGSRTLMPSGSYSTHPSFMEFYEYGFDARKEDHSEGV